MNKNIGAKDTNCCCTCIKPYENNLKVRLCCLFLMFCIFQNNIYSQVNCSYNLSGKVLDKESNESLPGVLIEVINSQKFFTSDENGNFSLNNLCSENVKVLVSSIGYTDSTFTLSPNNTNIYLSRDDIELNSVLIFQEKEKDEGTKTMSQQSLNLDERGSNRTFSLASIASEIDGVSFISSGSNVELPVIHGLYGNRILVLNNYLKHGFQNWGKEHAPEINMSSVSNLRVIKGASGVRFGPEGLGGAVIVEADPMKLSQPFYLKLNTGYETNGKGTNLGFNLGQGYKNLGYTIGYNNIKIGDRHTPDYMLTNSGKEEQAVNLGIHYHLKSFDIKLYYNYVNLNNGLLRASIFHSGNAISRAFSSDVPLIINPFSYSINEPNQLATHHLAKANINWWYSEDEKISLTFGAQKNERREYDVRRNSQLPIINLELFSYDYLLEWDHNLSDNIGGILGLHYFSQNNDNIFGTQTTPFIPNYNSNRLSFYMVEGYETSKNLFEFGMRYDVENYNVRGRETNQDIFRDENDFSNLTFSFGFERKISDKLSFRSNVGSAWRTPNMAELYSFGSHGFKNSFGLLRHYFTEDGRIKTDKVLTMDGDHFTSEKSLKLVNEINFVNQKSNLKITLHSNYISNYIFDKPIGLFGTIRGPMPYFVFDQTDVLFLGSDITYSRDISKNIKSAFTLSYLFTENLNDGGNLIDQPPIRINNTFDWTTNNFWKINSSEISITPSYTLNQFRAPITITPDELINDLVTIDPQSDIFDFKDAPEGYFLLDFLWKFKIMELDASFLIKNVLNKKYRNYLNKMRYFADEPGRNFIINLSYTFKKKN